jgi:type IV secretory pathway TraG/TraD family ATPase VirD4
MAGLGMIVWAFAQDLNQLKRDYPDHWETLVGNVQAMICMGVMDNFTAEYVSKMLGTRTIEHQNVSTTQDAFSQVGTSTSSSTQVMSRPLFHPDEVRGLGGDFSIIMGHFPPICARRIVYHQDWDFLHCARPDPHFPRTENVRWVALQYRLFEMGSVARLLKEYGYEVKRRRFGRWEVQDAVGSGKPTRSFANDNELWRWTYILAMDGVDSA